MEKTLGPAARVRRRFLQGAPPKNDTIHTPLSAINAAVVAIDEVRKYIREKEPTLNPDCAEVGLVVFTRSEKPPVEVLRLYPDPQKIGALFAHLAAKKEPSFVGMIFTIHDAEEKGGWVKPFVYFEESVDILRQALEQQLDREGLTN